MYRALPRGNKLCAQKEEERRQALHRNKLRDIRSTLDTKPPEVMKLDHLRTNAKREQLLDERFMEIDRSNRILLQKMGEIMAPGKKQNSSLNPGSGLGGKSLNSASRKKEFDRITHENLHILKRIQRAQPMYDHVKWEQHHRSHLSRLRNCAEYPIVLDVRPAAPLPPASAPTLVPSPIGNNATVAGGSEQPTVAMTAAAVHKEGRKFGEQYFLLEMATDGRALTVSAYDGESQQTLELVVNEKNHRKLFRECHGDYGLLAKRVHIHNNRISLE
jgi:hypothetical protein